MLHITIELNNLHMTGKSQKLAQPESLKMIYCPIWIMAKLTSTRGSVVKTVVSWLRIIRSRLRSQRICTSHQIASEVALIFQHVWTSDWPIAPSDCLIFCDFLFAIPLWSHQLLVAALLSIWSQQLYHTMSDLLEIIICIVCQFILTFSFQSKKFTWLASFISLSSVMLPHFLI